MKIINKIIILFIIVLCIASASILYIIKTENKKTRLLIESHQNSQKNTIKNIIKFKSDLLQKVAFDYTYWDDMVNFIKTKDSIWAQENIKSLSISFKIDASWVYNLGKERLYHYHQIFKSNSLCNIISKETLNKLQTHKFINYFELTKVGIIEIIGACIHNTKDIERKEPAKGFFFIGKLWDENYLNEIGELSASKITLQPLTETSPQSNRSTIISIDTIYNVNKEPLIKLISEKNIDYISTYRKLTLNSFIYISLLALILTIIFVISFKNILNKPISAIIKFLNAQDPKPIQKLKYKKDEFGRIARLVIDSFNQKEAILKEVNERKIIEKSLLESQKRLQAIINNTPNIAIEGYDIEGKVLFWNDAATKIFGFTEKEVIGKPISHSILSRADFIEFIDTLKQVDKTNEATKPTEWNAKTKQNKIITVLSTIFPIYLDYSDEKFFVCMDVDISDRKLLEIELQSKNEEIIAQNEELTVANEELTETYSKIRNSEEIFRSVIEQANDGIALIDSDCKIIEWNKAMEAITGFTNEETIGNFIWEIEFQMLPLDKRTPQTKANIEKIIKQIAKNKIITELNKYIEGDIFDKKTQRLKFIQLSTFLIQTEKGFLIGRMAHDLTNILEANKTIEISEKRFKDLSELLPSVVFETDLKGKFTYLNKKAFELFGYSYLDFEKGILFIDVIPEERQEEAISIFKNVIEGGVNFSIETPLLTKMGKVIPCIIYPSLIKDINNNPTGLRGVLADISEQKKSEELNRQLEVSKKTSEIKQQFLANMSHEIRTPMMGIIGMIDLLNKTDITEQQKDFIETIKESSETLLHIINDILDLAKIEAGKTEIKLNTFNIHTLTHKTKTLFSALAKHKNIKFITTYSNDIPDYIIADENKVTQILTNLISNAVKFTHEGSIRVNISIIISDNNKKQAKIEVIDTGIGISQANQNIIFSSFTQIESSNNRNFEGTGLGLSICKKLVQLLGGEIGVISHIDKGSTFWFTFNFDFVSQENILKIAFDKEYSEIQKLNQTVLLVEDKFVNQKVIELMLKDVGCDVTIASNGQIAVDLFKPSKFDVILMDIQMPVMDGISTVRFLKSKYPVLPPIIALSANVMEGDEANYLSEGMNDYIAKPVNQKILVEKIAKWTINKK